MAAAAAVAQTGNGAAVRRPAAAVRTYTTAQFSFPAVAILLPPPLPAGVAVAAALPRPLGTVAVSSPVRVTAGQEAAVVAVAHRSSAVCYDLLIHDQSYAESYSRCYYCHRQG